jgi:hypothetical protein
MKICQPILGLDSRYRTESRSAANGANKFAAQLR